MHIFSFYKIVCRVIYSPRDSFILRNNVYMIDRIMSPE